MKSFVLFAVWLTVSIAAISGATWRGNYTDPRYPGKCVISEDVILSPGEDINNLDNSCVKVMCGSKGFAVFYSCGVQMVEGCRMGDYIDRSLPYPECCKRYVICD